MKLQELREKLLNQRSEPPEMKEVISNIWRMSEPRIPPKPEELTKPGSTPRSAETRELELPLAAGESNPTLGEPIWIFETFAKRIDELSVLLGSLEALSQSTADVLELLDVFETRMEQLATNLQPVRAFCAKLEELAPGSQPLGIVHKQIVGIMEQFRTHLLQMANLVEPAAALRLRAKQLAGVLEPADELGVRFARLAHAFQMVPRRESAPVHGGARS